MTDERFAALAAAYGADIGRWPEGEREAARRLAAQAPARDVLAAESDLDHLLWQATTAAPSHALSEAVIAMAPPARRTGGEILRWLAAVGVAGSMVAACAAGVVMGATFAPHALINVMTPHASPQAQPPSEETALDGGLGGDV
ncbi:hypothetical protein ACO2Q3_05165 [Caulobacter sp. KR2-114]|uniref:hypothetical protein n=1 Tax=Caulobacter sp. KR2-114 TaxID=3400912 RepID=UPI003C0A5960